MLHLCSASLVKGLADRHHAADSCFSPLDNLAWLKIYSYPIKGFVLPFIIQQVLQQKFLHASNACKRPPGAGGGAKFKERRDKNLIIWDASKHIMKWKPDSLNGSIAWNANQTVWTALEQNLMPCHQNCFKIATRIALSPVCCWLYLQTLHRIGCSINFDQKLHVSAIKVYFCRLWRSPTLWWCGPSRS